MHLVNAIYTPSPQNGKQAWPIWLSCFTTSSSSLNQLRLSQLWSAHFPAWDVSTFPLLHLTVQLQWLVHFKSFRCGQFKFRKSSSDWKTFFIFHTTYLVFTHFSSFFIHNSKLRIEYKWINIALLRFPKTSKLTLIPTLRIHTQTAKRSLRFITVS